MVNAIVLNGNVQQMNAWGRVKFTVAADGKADASTGVADAQLRSCLMLLLEGTSWPKS